LAFYYLETSALVKLYVRETGTERMLAMTARSAENRLAMLALTQVEFRSAIRRRERAGEIPSTIAVQLLDAFTRHLETRFITQPISDFVLDLASSLIDRHALRAFDAIQLAGCAALKNATGSEIPIFVCADQALIAAAQQEGMPTLDPIHGP